MQKSNWILFILIIVLAVLILFKPYYGWEIRKFLAPDFGAGNNAQKLALENENLKAELARLEDAKTQFPDRTPGFIGAMVYSRYPMNFKNEFLISAGAKDGVLANKAVIISGVLIGKVSKVFNTTALVQTIFDGGFQATVRIGNRGVQALLRGGTLPKLTMIPLAAGVSKGDIVYSASADFPYGLSIGTIENVSTSSDKLFHEATLNFAYDINSVSAVLVAK